MSFSSQALEVDTPERCMLKDAREYSMRIPAFNAAAPQPLTLSSPTDSSFLLDVQILFECACKGCIIFTQRSILL